MLTRSLQPKHVSPSKQQFGEKICLDWNSVWKNGRSTFAQQMCFNKACPDDNGPYLLVGLFVRAIMWYGHAHVANTDDSNF